MAFLFLMIHVLTREQWKILQNSRDCLKIFCQVSEKVAGEDYVTLSTTVVLLNLLMDKLETLCSNKDNKPDRNAVDQVFIKVFQNGRDKNLKHKSKCNSVYCVSFVLDLRHEN